MVIQVICFDLGFTVRQDYFTHFGSSQSVGGVKTGDTCPPASRIWLVSHVTRTRLEPTAAR